MWTLANNKSLNPNKIERKNSINIVNRSQENKVN